MRKLIPALAIAGVLALAACKTADVANASPENAAAARANAAAVACAKTGKDCPDSPN